MEYIPANESDKEYFRDLNEQCYEDLARRQFGSWDAGLQSQAFDAKWETQQFQKIFVDDNVVGGIWVEENPQDNQLKEIQIHPMHQNKGIGTLVVQDVIKQAQTDGKRLWLKVLHQNQALNLYERLGFIVTEKTDVQYIMVWGTQA